MSFDLFFIYKVLYLPIHHRLLVESGDTTLLCDIKTQVHSFAFWELNNRDKDNGK